MSEQSCKTCMSNPLGGCINPSFCDVKSPWGSPLPSDNGVFCCGYESTNHTEHILDMVPKMPDDKELAELYRDITDNPAIKRISTWRNEE